MTSSKLTIIFQSILLLVFLSACQDARKPTELSTDPPVHFEPCYLTAPGVSAQISARCGDVEVYEDRAAQSGRKISIHLTIIPAVSRNPSPDPIFFLAGGPGEAATESFPLLYPALSQINRKRDIILVDQRGTGNSNPLRCPEFGPWETNPESEAATQAYLENCLANLNADPRLYTTSLAMDDLEEIRQVLGYEKINLLGASYGTRAAQVYARKYGDHVRTMILDGVVPLNWTLGPSVAGDAQRALNLIFERCEDEPACHSAFPNLSEEFENLLERLKSAPVSVALIHPSRGDQVNQVLTREAFANLIHTLSYAPETAALLPLMIHQAYQAEDYRPLAAQYIATLEQLNEQVSVGMRLSVLCSEDAPFFDSEPASEGYLEEFFQNSLLPLCDIWPAGEIPADFKQPLQSGIPTLLLSGEADPITPPSNGEQVSQFLTHSLHVIAPDQGHIVIFRGCIPEIATAFIETASVNEPDVSCVQEIKPMPFFTNPNGPTP